MSLDPAVAAVRRAVRPCLPGHGQVVLVACSGGADSLALLAAAVHEGRRADVRVVGVTVDHGLQDGSAEHAERVVTQMAGLGADETVAVRVRVESRRQGPEAAARQARYAVLEQVAQRFGEAAGFHVPANVLLGHTLDDQAETVLLGLTRGSGGRSLAGMRRGFDCFVRPLLEVTRTQTEAACRADDIEWWDDPHNHDPRFTRSRVRQRVLPVLEEELGPGVAAALARTADLLRTDSWTLDEIAERAYRDLPQVDGGYPTARLESMLGGVSSRVVRLLLLDAGCPPSELFRVHVSAVEALTEGTAGDHVSKQVQLPGHVTAYREGNLLRFRRTAVPG
ncbi:MAG TPA: tRNA lysidine(34) synthetase TilS [Nocardioidaceae bacterium]|nr:tRNA lysidine(34) synthetase TilS [Nocardioidaceae bacterium]